MLRNIAALEKYEVQANDGPIGYVQDFFFDDESWVVRYVLVDTCGWLSDPKVLISPSSIGFVDAKRKHLRVLLDREQIENSLDIESDVPVSRRRETRYFNACSYPSYRDVMGLCGAGSSPSLMIPDFDGRSDSVTSSNQQQQLSEHGRPSELGKVHSGRSESSLAALDDSISAKHDFPHLRSCKLVLNHEIRATDGLIGHVEGFLVDEKAWAIRYLIVKTGRWWLGHRVLVVPDWITSVDWSEHTVAVDVSRAAIRGSPPSEFADELDHEQEWGSANTRIAAAGGPTSFKADPLISEPLSSFRGFR